MNAARFEKETHSSYVQIVVILPVRATRAKPFCLLTSAGCEQRREESTAAAAKRLIIEPLLRSADMVPGLEGDKGVAAQRSNWSLSSVKGTNLSASETEPRSIQEGNQRARRSLALFW